MTAARATRHPDSLFGRRLATLALAVLGLVAASGCTLLEDPDDHFRADTAGGDDTSDDTTGATALCGDYCTRYLELCQSNAANTYSDQDDCEAKCATLPEGSATDYARNSVRCRMNHFGGAVGDPGEHCPHASFEGGDQCVGDEVSACESYCALLSENCPQTFAELETPDSPLSSAAMCIKFCGGFLPSPGGAGNPIFVTDSLECRTDFLGRMTAPNMPGLYCEAATPGDAQACRGAVPALESTCEALCLIAFNECPGALPFQDFAACREGCAGETLEAVNCALDHLVGGAAPACDAISPIGEACGATSTCEPDQPCGLGCGAEVATEQCACGPGTSVCDANGTTQCFHNTTGSRVAAPGQLTELCANDTDDDCDGLIDLADDDCTTCTEGADCGATCPGAVTQDQCACKAGTQTCANGMPEACLDASGAAVTLPFSQPEQCNNGIDDNCDGQIDEADCTSP